jgi:hypothetical protein
MVKGLSPKAVIAKYAIEDTCTEKDFVSVFQIISVARIQPRTYHQVSDRTEQSG